MTPEAKKSIRAAGAVLFCVFAICVGAILRDRTELGPSSDATVNISNLVASTSDATVLPETRFFSDIEALLKHKYVDPITDDTKLADGSVRGMVASLGDSDSLYMDADQVRVYGNARLGSYEGIGADLILSNDKPESKIALDAGDDADPGEFRLPKLLIAAIVPGGPADKAGLKVGDWAEFVDDHWIPNTEAFDQLQTLHKAVLDHKPGAGDEYLRVRRKLRDDAEKNILPIKARDRLMMGASGSVKTRWVRGTARIDATLEKAASKMPGFGAEADGAIRLPFISGSSNNLRDALNGKTEARIDLRNNTEGDFEAMMSCLKEVAAKGSYGFLVTHKSEKPTPLDIAESGGSSRTKLTLLVDSTTRGAAEIFALALSTHAGVKLDGVLTASTPKVVRWFSLPDGAGYSLVTAEYRSKESGTVVATAAPVSPSDPKISGGKK